MRLLDAERPVCQRRVLSEKASVNSNKYGETEWTLWDRFEFKNDPTLKEFISWFKTNHNLDVSMVSQGVSMLWSSFIGKKKVMKTFLRQELV